MLLEQLLGMPGTQSAQLDGIVARVRGLAAWQHSLQVPPCILTGHSIPAHAYLPTNPVLRRGAQTVQWFSRPTLRL